MHEGWRLFAYLVVLDLRYATLNSLLSRWKLIRDTLVIDWKYYLSKYSSLCSQKCFRLRKKIFINQVSEILHRSTLNSIRPWHKKLSFIHKNHFNRSGFNLYSIFHSKLEKKRKFSQKIIQIFTEEFLFPIYH